MSHIDELYKVQKSELKAAASIIADAFSDKPSLKKLDIPPEDLRNMFGMMIRLGMRYGEVYAPSSELEGIMVFLPEKYAVFNTWHVIRSGAIWSVVKIKKKLMDILKETGELIDEDRKNLTIGPYLYLLAIGVSREHQGRGAGGRLLQPLFEKADAEEKAVYLETDTRENVSLYEHYGFEVTKELELPTLNVPMWEMTRYPSK